ncbi:MAG: hypothetical protein B6226_05405 [Candidatus Cloacimonetes bacterium 4572_65]|nr:MAG: hypothetical protein B6226_05405 [Candidatus Cloacimonetes bacterium 4572_65]
MPIRDGSGPNGNGPQTGRGMGNCNPDSSKTTGNAERGFGGGRGMSRNGRGCNDSRGFGRRNGGFGNGNRRFDEFETIESQSFHNDKSYIQSVITYLGRKLELYKKRLTELDK